LYPKILGPGGCFRSADERDYDAMHMALRYRHRTPAERLPLIFDPPGGTVRWTPFGYQGAR